MRAVALFLWLGLATGLSRAAEVQLALTECRTLFNVVAPSPKGGEYELHIGDAVTITQDGVEKPISAVFVGRFIGSEGTAKEAVFYEKDNNRLHFMPLKDLKMKRGDGGDIDPEKTYPLTKPVPQQGMTCSSFADFACMLQIRHRTGGKGVKMDSPAERLYILSRALADSYQHRTGWAMHSFTSLAQDALFEYSREKLPQARDKLKETILETLQEGWPVIIHYDIRSWERRGFEGVRHLGSEKTESGSATTGLGTHQWLPMQKRPWFWNWMRKKLWMKEKSPGRHAVVLLGVLEGPNGSKKLLVLDPNWDHPVLWDADELNYAVPAQIDAYKFSWKPREAKPENTEPLEIAPEGPQP